MLGLVMTTIGLKEYNKRIIDEGLQTQMVLVNQIKSVINFIDMYKISGPQLKG